MVNGVDFIVTELVLSELFRLAKEGCTPRGKKEFYDKDRELIVINIEEARKFMRENHKVIDVDVELLDQNDFGVK